ncbi:MAG: tetratricopeptide repeat protein [Myxococcota bacterium]|jgi:Tfp pilus assembly protein PilF|nr:tetratricopeptide repeat protein [Myxococcota bacterium]
MSWARIVAVLALGAALGGCITAQRAQKALGHHQLAQAYFDEGDVSGTIVELREAIRLNPYLPESHHLLANCYFVREMFDDAEKEFRTALRLQDPFPEAQLNLGAMLASRGRWDDAIVAFQAAADEPTYRESGRAIHNLGWAYYNQGRFEESRAAYQRVLEVTPLFCPSIHNMGLVSEAEGKLDEAESYFLRARKCNKADLNTWMALGKLYLRLDNLEQAEFHLDFVQSHDENGALGDEARQLLDELGG